MDLEEIKNKIKSSPILSDSEKQEWLFLLPKMTESQKDELLRILEVRMPSAPTAQDSIKYPVSSIEQPPSLAPSHQGREIESSKISSPLARDVTSELVGEGRRGEAVPIPDTKYQILNTASMTLEAMRQAPSIYEFFDNLGAQMAVKVKTNAASAAAVVADFQASSLYRAYVASGRAMLEGREPQALTRSEFEAVAEFRASLRKVLQGGT